MFDVAQHIAGNHDPCMMPLRRQRAVLVALLVAVASQQVGLGLLFILAFSLGLAMALTGIGLLMVYSRNLLSRFTSRRVSVKSTCYSPTV